MGFLKHFRSKSKLKNEQPEAQVYGWTTKYNQVSGKPTAAGILPPNVLDLIFSFVCPHSLDESYLSSEESMDEDGCPLCHIRDLAHCGLMNRNWHNAVEKRLYHSVRLETVHYCAREIELSEKRKRHRKFDRNGIPQDPTQQRLQLFYRTVASNQYHGSLVNLLKMPYMTRESCKGDLARTVSVLPNLRYVDLPDGFFSGDHATQILRQELMNRCPEIRKMKYLPGAEQSFTILAHQRMWQNLESLELTGLEIDADVLLYVLASFPALRTVKLGGEGMTCLTDEILTMNPNVPPFPPLTRLVLHDAPHITANGLCNYFSRPETRENLAALDLNHTGVLPQELFEVLSSASNLTHLSYYEVVTKTFPISPIPSLASRTLQSLAFEILPEHLTTNPISETYYSYLATSLLSGGFPRLSECYAYSPSLPDLLFAPPLPPFGGGGSGPSPNHLDPSAQVMSSRFSTLSVGSSKTGSSSLSFAPPASLAGGPRVVPVGLRSPLALYTKSPAAPELEWSLTTIDPPSDRNGRRGSASATRPLSLVMSEKDGRGGQMVGNGLGGYLNVPGQGEHGPNSGFPAAGHSFGHARKASRVGQGMGEWMG